MVKLVNGVIMADNATGTTDGGSSMTSSSGSGLTSTYSIFGFVLPAWALGGIVLMGFMFGGGGGGLVMAAVLGVVSGDFYFNCSLCHRIYKYVLRCIVVCC
jgi:hypothetical protein